MGICNDACMPILSKHFDNIIYEVRDMNEWWSPVLVVGVIILILIAKRNSTGKRDVKFDERQEQIRGKAYKYAFLGSTFSMVSGIIFTGIYGDMLMDTPFLLAVCVCIGAGIFAVYSITKDAYIAFNRNIYLQLIIFTVVGVLNIAGGIHMMLFENVLTDGRMTISMINLVVGILFMVITFAMIVKLVSERQNDAS